MNLTAKQFYAGSPAYSLYLNGKLVGFWSTDHQGPLPSFYEIMTRFGLR
jgi:hypothetical protein